MARRKCNVGFSGTTQLLATAFAVRSAHSFIGREQILLLLEWDDGIVVSRGRAEDSCRDREWRADVIAACLERFERRLVEEVAGLRVQLAQTEALLPPPT